MRGATVLSGTLTSKATAVRVTFPDGSTATYAARLPALVDSPSDKPFIADLASRAITKTEELHGPTVIATRDLRQGE